MISDVIQTYLEEELNINEVLTDDEKIKFYKRLRIYLTHSRTGESAGRTDEYFITRMNKLVKYASYIGLSSKQIFTILTNDFSFINQTEIIGEKYLFLGLIEDEENSVRLHHLLQKPKDFRMSTTKMNKRYAFLQKYGYPNINFNNVVHMSDKEFLNLFVRTTYYKPYQVFNDIVDAENAYNYFVAEEVKLEDLMKLPQNKEIMNNAIQSRSGK